MVYFFLNTYLRKTKATRPPASAPVNPGINVLNVILSSEINLEMVNVIKKTILRKMLLATGDCKFIFFIKISKLSVLNELIKVFRHFIAGFTALNSLQRNQALLYIIPYGCFLL